MDNRYKVIISNKRIYKEIKLSGESESIRIGTTKACSVRLRKELFFEDIEIALEQVGGKWQLVCQENIYISADGVMKLASKTLVHGDDFLIKYQKSNQEIFKISFMIDFDFEKKDYCRTIDIRNCDTITIGGNNDNNICINEALISGDVIKISKNKGKLLIFDNNSKYGVYVNGEKIKGSKDIEDYDFISVIDYSFFYKQGVLYTSPSDKLRINGLNYIDEDKSIGNRLYPKFNRNTRINNVISEEPISVLDPPPIPMKPKKNILLTLMPALGMLGLTVVLRGVMGGGGSFVIFSVCTMGMGIATSIISHISGKKEYRKEVRDREEKYNKYISNKRIEIETARREEKQILEEIYHSPSNEYAMVKEFSGNLFERNPKDKDFLHIRIGTGSLVSKRIVEYKKQEKFEIEDPFANIPEQLSQEYKYIDKAPVVCNLCDNNAVGVIGENSQQYELMKNMILDLCVRQYQSDVKIFIILDEERRDMIEWTKWLPHIENEDFNIRNIVCDDESKTTLFEYLYKVFSYRENLKEQVQKSVVFVLDDMGIKKHPVSKYIDKANSYGFTFVFFEDTKERLPIGCNQVITLNPGSFTGNIIDAEDANSVTNFNYELISDELAEEMAIKLAPVYIEEVSLEGNLTKNISLFQLLNILAVEDLDLKKRWDTSEVYKSMAAPLGVKSKNEIVCLDIHEKFHGPHGLVAGTTGSGKSEILQSYILSMATLFHPYEVSFMIIDFKGGGMVNQFLGLSHLAGAITNIDGKEIDRSLKSIKAELKKRQKCFAEAGVNHIDAYIKKYKNKEVTVVIPHLIVIVDEFAELKAEQPEFMKELISAARIGRSLGVHLILATQKPAGQVNEQIWSNSKFKLCLKVQTKEDSNEVLKSPLAAEIKEPGRSYFQVGNNEIFELFQSAYSGAPAKDDEIENKKEFYISEVSLSGRRNVVYAQKRSKSNEEMMTQLNAVVDYIHDHCVKNNIPRLQSICLPPLAATMTFEVDLAEEYAGIVADIGIYDDPDNQYQGKAVMNIGAENTMIIGSAQYGKTNLLQTMIRSLASRYTPEELNIYIIDFASMVLKSFEGLNHCGGVVCSYEDEKLKNLFKLLNSEIETRKEKLMSIGVSSFSSYREAGYKDIPQIVLVIDNLTALKELYLQDNDILSNICREGLTVGISVIVANSQLSGIGYRYLSNFSSRIALFCNDSSEYSSLFDHCRLKPENIAGRSILEINRIIYECQTYLSFVGEKEIDRVKEMKAFIEEQNSKYSEIRAKNIPVIPQVLTDYYINQQFSYLRKPYHTVLGLNYSDVTPLNIDVRNIGVLTVTGRDGFGKGNFIKNLVSTLSEETPVKISIIDDINKKFSYLQENKNVQTYSMVAENIKEVLAEWDAELESRYNALVNGEEEKLEKSPLLLLIIENQDVPASISADKDALARYKQILSKYKSLKVAIIYSFIANAPVPYSANEVLKMIKDNKNYLVFEDIANFKIIDLPLSSIRDFKKPIEVGDAYYVRENSLVKLKTVLSTVKH